MIPSDEILAMALLSADSVFGKIPHDRYLYYIKESMNAGEEAAEKYKGKTIEELCSDLGTSLSIEDKAARYGGVKFRAQTITEKGYPTIHVYRESIDSLAENSAWDDREGLNGETALNAHVYHELFHVHEERNGYVSSCLDTVVILKIFSYTRRSHVTQCSEIAAHRFAQQMLQLPCMPNFFDYIYLFNTNQMNREQFDSFFSRMETLLQEAKGEKR